MIACMSDLMIEIEHLHKTYRSGFTMKPKLALKDVSFNVEAGKVYGFIGPNGLHAEPWTWARPPERGR